MQGTVGASHSQVGFHPVVVIPRFFALGTLCPVVTSPLLKP